MDFPGGASGKNTACQCRTWVQPLALGRSLEEGMATHRSILAWRISWTEEPARLWSIAYKDSSDSATLHAYRGILLNSKKE